MLRTDEAARNRGETLRCDAVPERDGVRVELWGEIDMVSADVVREQLRYVMGAGFRRVVLDLRGATFLDSTGLRVILEALEDARARAIDFTVAPGPPNVQRIFELTSTAALVFGEAAPAFARR